MSDLVITQEESADCDAIYRLTKLAFAGRPYAEGDEQDLINKLRDVGALTMSLVAFTNNELVGQATFSPASQSDGSAPWYALGPISVHPDHQSQGIGGALIKEGLGGLIERGALGCILTGNPKYYRRFGFELSPEHVPQAESQEYFQIRYLTAFRPRGRFCFHEAFYD